MSMHNYPTSYPSGLDDGNWATVRRVTENRLRSMFFYLDTAPAAEAHRMVEWLHSDLKRHLNDLAKGRHDYRELENIQRAVHLVAELNLSDGSSVELLCRHVGTKVPERVRTLGPAARRAARFASSSYSHHLPERHWHA